MSSPVLYSRIAYKGFDDWHGYFLKTSLGASGLAFAIQVWYSFTRVCSFATFSLSFSPKEPGSYTAHMSSPFFVPTLIPGACQIHGAPLCHNVLLICVMRTHCLHRTTELAAKLEMELLVSWTGVNIN